MEHSLPAHRPLDPPLSVLLAATGLFALALWLRLSGTVWDGWANLHPDERHMVFVTQDMQRALAAALAEGRGWWSIWFEPGSPLDPRAEGRLYVYGDLPLWVVTLVSHALGTTDWGQTLWLGRCLTALIEATTVLAVFVLSLRVTGRPLPALGAAALMVFAPTSLQLANFYTVDGWLAALCGWALVAFVAMARMGTAKEAVIAGLLTGLAAACKVTAIALVLPALAALWFVWRARGAGAAGLCLLVGAVTAFLMFRVANPSAFAGPGFWGFWPSAGFVADFAEARAYARDPGPPSNWQWLAGYSTAALARDMLLFGTGPVLGVLAMAGLLRRPREPATVLVLAAFAGHLALNATGEIRALRYLAPVVPLAAILAAPMLVRLPTAALMATLAVAAWWGSGTIRLHDGQHPRVMATEWMRRLPAGTAIASETDWDEALPVWQTFPAAPWSEMPGPFTTVRLRLTDVDDAGTAGRLAAALDQADYISVSSGRQIEVMPRLPDRFPTVTRYYDALLSGRLCFVRVFHVDRGYPLPFLPLDDSFSQEPWRVYDHPIVQIWQKQPCFDRATVERILTGKG